MRKPIHIPGIGVLPSLTTKHFPHMDKKKLCVEPEFGMESGFVVKRDKKYWTESWFFKERDRRRQNKKFFEKIKNF